MAAAILPAPPENVAEFFESPAGMGNWLNLKPLYDQTDALCSTSIDLYRPERSKFN
jgi:hypothetical protein